MKQPFFSIVIPTKDRPECVSILLESVKKQTYADFEVIVSDNTSKTPCKSAVDAVADDRFAYYRNESSLGICDSFEAAISHAKGKWIMMFGDKNILYPDALEKLHHVIVKEKPEIINWGQDYLAPVNSDRNLVYGKLKKLRRTGRPYPVDPLRALKEHMSCRHLMASTEQTWYLGCIFAGGVQP